MTGPLALSMAVQYLGNIDDEETRQTHNLPRCVQDNYKERNVHETEQNQTASRWKILLSVLNVAGPCIGRADAECNVACHRSPLRPQGRWESVRENETRWNFLY